MSDGDQRSCAIDRGAEAAGCDPRALLRRRASTRITLVLIGTASMTGCGNPEPALVQRDLYEHRSQCVQDWGDERKCDLITEGQHRGYWYGPGYSGDRTSRSQPGGGAGMQTRAGRHALATHTVARSGFGSSARAHSSGS